MFALLFAGKNEVYLNRTTIVHFIDSIRELRKYAGVEMTDLKTPQAEVQAHMKQFRSQRNFYIAGFALFLWLYVENGNSSSV